MVFISSSISELWNERQAVKETLESIPLTKPWVFEYTPASTDNLDESYLSKVRECDIFILLIAENISSPVKHEYRAAFEDDKPMLVFLKDSQFMVPFDNVANFKAKLTAPIEKPPLDDRPPLISPQRTNQPQSAPDPRDPITRPSIDLPDGPLGVSEAPRGPDPGPNPPSAQSGPQKPSESLLDDSASPGPGDAKYCTCGARHTWNQKKCKKCGLCFKGCPVDAIYWKKKEVAVIDKDKCIKCMTCLTNCRFDAIF